MSDDGRAEAVKVANRTYRNRGAVGANPLCYRHVRQSAFRGDRILDYGAGTHANHTNILREKYGFKSVDAFEIGDNYRKEIHVKTPKKGSYDVVVVSNVLNVINDYDMLVDTIKEISSFVKKDGGLVIFNYPKSPRKLRVDECKLLFLFLHHTPLIPIQIGNTEWACRTKKGDK